MEFGDGKMRELIIKQIEDYLLRKLEKEESKEILSLIDKFSKR